MPYLGQRPSKGDENNFKILDNISSYTLTFDGSDAAVVSAANDTITSLSHRFVQGQRVTYNKGGGTVITGLSDGVYYIIKNDHNTIKLATSASNAANGTAVNITGVGAGSSHTLNVAFDGVNTKFKATHTNGQKAKITRSAQLVISINGVIQQPHDSATPSTGFGFDLDGTIVFSQAPVVGDVYWAHVLTNNNVTFDISDNDVDNFTGNASTTAFNLSKTPPDNRNVLVTIDGVVQYPNDPDGTVRAYNVVENVLTFTTAPVAGAEIQVRHIGFAGSSSGSGGGGVTNFYGRTGSVVLKSTDNITVNDAAITGNATVTGDLTVNGTTTTLDTQLVEVDKIEVETAGTNVAVAVTHNGSGDLVRLYDGTVQKVTVDGNGYVGIGTNNIDSPLEVVGTGPSLVTIHHGDGGTNDEARIMLGALSNNPPDNRGAGIAAVNNGAGHDLIIKCSTNHSLSPSEKLRIKNDGKVGIGTNNPATELEIHGNSGGTIRLAKGGANRTTILAGDTLGKIEFRSYDASLNHTSFNGTYAQIETVAVDDLGGLPGENVRLDFKIADSDEPSSGKVVTPVPALSILQGGNVGINQTAPTSMLQVDYDEGNSKVGLRLRAYNASGSKTWQLSEINGNAGVFSIRNATNSINVLNIKSDGTVGIGTDNPQKQLQILGDADTCLRLTSSAGGVASYQLGDTTDTVKAGITLFNSDNSLRIRGYNNSERIIITSGGLVGIGITNPEAYEANGNNLVVGDTTSHNGITILTGTDKDGRLGFADGTGAASYRGMIEYQHGTGTDEFMKLHVAGDERLRITSDGKIGINQSSPTAELEVCPINTTVDTATIFINAKTHDTNVASEAILKFGYGHSGNPDAVGHIKLAENGGNNFDGDLIFGLPTNNSAGGSVTNERFRIRYNGQVSISNAGTTFGNNTLLNIAPANRTTTFDASDGDTWHDVVVKQSAAATTNSVGLAFEISPSAYHKNAGTGIAAIKDGNNFDYGTHLAFITRPHTAVAEERLRIRSDGIIETGTAIGDTAYDGNQRLRVGRTGDCSISIRANGSTTAFTGLDFGDDDDDRAGRIQYAHDGNYMSFHTNGAGTGSANERLRISANTLRFNSTAMQIHLATSDGSDNGYLNIGAAGGANNQNRGAQAVFYGNEHSSYAGQCGILAGNSGSTQGYIYFKTGGSERLRIKSNGEIVLGNVSNTSGNTNSAVHIESAGMNVESSYDTDDTSGGVPHLTLSGQSTRVRMDFGTLTVAPYAGFIQTRFDNNPFGNSGSDDGLEPLLLNPKGGVLGYNIHDSSAVNAVGGGYASTQGGIVMRAGRANSTVVNNASTAIKIYPGEIRAYSGTGGTGEQNQGTKYGGIAWNILDPHNGSWGSNHSGHHCWMGMSLHSTPAQEKSNWQVQMNNDAGAGTYANIVAIQASPAGYVTKPQTPAFFATHTGAGNPATGVLVYNTSGNGYYNNGSHLDTSTGKFTAPINGIYTFHFHGFIQNNDPSDFFETTLRRDRSGSTLSLTRQYGHNGHTGNNYGPSISMHCTTYLNKNDTVYVHQNTGGVGFHGSNGYYFGGYLVG